MIPSVFLKTEPYIYLIRTYNYLEFNNLIIFFVAEKPNMIKTGEILRRDDGNYCFSCNHCDAYFDVIHEIIDHMDRILDHGKVHQKIKSKSDSLSYTEFVDVSVPIDVKCEIVDDYVNDIIPEDDKDWDYMNDLNDNTPLAEQNIIGIKLLNIKCDADEGQQVEIINTSTSLRKPNGQKRQTISVKSINKFQCCFQIREDKNDQDDYIKCCWCPEKFNDFGLMLDHLTDDHNKKQSDVYSCCQCQLVFKNVNLLSEHILTNHGQDEYEKFHKDMDYEKNSKSIQCAVCQLWTNGTKSFDAHTKQAHQMYRILQCYICGIFKKKPSGLLDHLRVHDRFRKYRCYECDSVEPKITNPNDIRSHKCILCSVWFMNHATMRNHIAEVHGQDQIYDCSICDDYTFKTDLDLKMHCMEIHQIVMDYKCNICSKQCKSIQSLKEHQKSHSMTPNINECNICSAKFRRKDYLIRHIKTHDEIKRDSFNCYICNKTFQSNGYLKNHIKRHTEKKMHQCDVCGNRFLLSGLLRKHMREHKGEIWKCQQCQKEFSNKSKLTAHEKTHVTERNFRCDVGDLFFSSAKARTFILTIFRFA